MRHVARAVMWTVVAGFCLGGLRVSADDKAEQQKKIAELQQQLDSLKAQIGGPPVGVGADTAKWYDSITMGGYLDVGFNWNPGRPALAGGTTRATGTLPDFAGTASGFNNPTSKSNTNRVFDNQANEFTLHAFELDIWREGKAAGEAGFRADVALGRDPQIYRSPGSSITASNDLVDLQQAYVTYNLLDSLQIRAGKYVTLAGAEVIESKDNWNYSRSYLFGWSIPFTHTGARLTWTGSEGDVPGLTLILGVVNGLNTITDANNGKTLEAGLTYMLPDWFPLGCCYSNAFYYGSEQAGNLGRDGAKQYVFSQVLTLSKLPLDGLTFMFNYDTGGAEKIVGTPGGAASIARAGNVEGDASWYGYAAYLKYDLKEMCPALDTWSLRFRGEMLNDRDGFLMGLPLSTVKELTFTLQYDVTSNFLTRLEYRHDWSDHATYISDGRVVNNMKTIGIEAIVTF